MEAPYVQRKARHPPLLLTHTFVVQLHPDTQIEAGQVIGRIEHLVSRHAIMFESLDAQSGDGMSRPTVWGLDDLVLLMPQGRTVLATMQPGVVVEGQVA
jgi:hypothetical protein